MKKVSIWGQKLAAAGLGLLMTPLAFAEGETTVDPSKLLDIVDMGGFSTKMMAIGGAVIIIAFIITGIYISIKAQKPARAA